jgi:hypothetical protein
MPISGHPWVACPMRTKKGSDPHICKHFEAWFFTYNTGDTGNPIAYAAARLRQALRAAVERFEPDGKDPAMRRMVLLDHSQGDTRRESL